MCKPIQGTCCAGCPHRAAYVVVKDAVGRGRGRVICGEAGCRAVGHVHPAATACPGGQERLLPRYDRPVPQGTAAEPGSDICAHFALDLDVFADEGAAYGAERLAGEGARAILCVMASSARFLDEEGVLELGRHLQGLGYASVSQADPLDTAGTGTMLAELLAEGGVHAVVFSSPCAQLVRAGARRGAGTAPAGEADGVDAAGLAVSPAEVDRFSCVGCMRCIQIAGCPALSFQPPAAFVDADACTGCDLCADYCRTHVILSARTGMPPAAKAELRRTMAMR